MPEMCAAFLRWRHQLSVVLFVTWRMQVFDVMCLFSKNLSLSWAMWSLRKNQLLPRLEVGGIAPLNSTLWIISSKWHGSSWGSSHCSFLSFLVGCRRSRTCCMTDFSSFWAEEMGGRCQVKISRTSVREWMHFGTIQHPISSCRMQTSHCCGAGLLSPLRRVWVLMVDAELPSLVSVYVQQSLEIISLLGLIKPVH